MIEGLMRIVIIFKDGVKHDKKHFKRSPYLVSTFGIYYLAFLTVSFLKYFFN